MIIAIVMAGGKGERLKANCEKPLYPLKDRSLIDYVLSNLNDSKLLDKVVIAVSPHTSRTKDYLINDYNMHLLSESSFSDFFNSSSNISDKSSLDLDSDLNFKSSVCDSKSSKDNFNHSKFFYLETPGNGYVEDLSFILNFFEKDSPDHTLLFINSDIPLATGEIIDQVLDVYEKSSKPALSVLVPSEIFKELCLDYSFEFNGKVPSGLNILKSENVIQEEEELIIRCKELAFNVNTIETARVISKFL